MARAASRRARSPPAAPLPRPAPPRHRNLSPRTEGPTSSINRNARVSACPKIPNLSRKPRAEHYPTVSARQQPLSYGDPGYSCFSEQAQLSSKGILNRSRERVLERHGIPDRGDQASAAGSPPLARGQDSARTGNLALRPWPATLTAKAEGEGGGGEGCGAGGAIAAVHAAKGYTPALPGPPTHSNPRDI